MVERPFCWIHLVVSMCKRLCRLSGPSKLTGIVLLVGYLECLIAFTARRASARGTLTSRDTIGPDATGLWRPGTARHADVSRAVPTPAPPGWPGLRRSSPIVHCPLRRHQAALQTGAILRAAHPYSLGHQAARPRPVPLQSRHSKAKSEAGSSGMRALLPLASWDGEQQHWPSAFRCPPLV